MKTYQALNEQYRSLLEERGFGEVEFHDWPGGESGEANKYLFVITSKKRVEMTYDTIIDHAIKWAKDRLGSQAYPFRCLAFVEDAYEKGNGIEIFGGSTAKESADEYGLQTGAEIPPRGAFIFYDCSGLIDGLVENWGHVGLSCGNGRVIHAWDTVREDDYRAVEELQPATGWTQPHYIGWASAERVLQGHIKRGMMTDKAKIIAGLQEEFQRCETFLSGLSEAAITAEGRVERLSIKDIVAHLTAWQKISAIRMGAGWQNREPVYPEWPAEFDTDSEAETDRINAWLYETYRYQPWLDVYQEWKERYEHLVEIANAIPENDLLESGKYPWLSEYPLSSVLTGTVEHHKEHLETLLSLRKWNEPD